MDTQNADRFSYKKLFFIWLPILLLVSIIISLIYIFSVENVRYLNSAFYFSLKENVLLNAFLLFLYAFDLSSDFIITISFICLGLFVFTEVYLIIRLIKLRKIEQSKFLKTSFRFINAQLIASIIFVFCSIFVPMISFGIASVYGYFDLKMSKDNALIGAISDQEEIVKKLRKAIRLLIFMTLLVSSE